MTIRSAIRDRFSPSDPASDRDKAGPGALPFAGYDRLDAKEVSEALPDHSQIELEAVESYERSHQGRGVVLDKLRFMRQPEPLAGYDALAAGEVVAALQEADLATIKGVRGYERKFANRPDVLEEVTRVFHRRQASEPARVVPAYQSVSASSATSEPSAPADRQEHGGPA